MSLKLGSKVRCKITGFEGTLTGRTEYINGCVQYLVRPSAFTTNDGEMKYAEGHWIDDQQLEVLKEAVTPASAPRGCDSPAPTSMG